MSNVRFSVIGIDHRHIFGQVETMLAAGAELVSFHAAGGLLDWFAEKYPQAKRIEDRDRILEDKSIQLVVGAGIPCERTPLAIDAMRHGKDVMVDKPGITSFEQLAEVRRVQAETKRIFSICYSEHFETRSTVKAGELVQAGAIGRVIATTGLGPHRLNKPTRPDWFFIPEQNGGILTDIASHQCEQFLFLTGADDAEVVAATVANYANPDNAAISGFRRDDAADERRERIHPRRLVHAGRTADLGRRATVHCRAPRAAWSCANMSISAARPASIISS